MIKINAIFHRKENDFKSEQSVVEKTITLPDEEFIQFRHNMIDDYEFIKENEDLMFTDSNNVHHCLLILGETFDDGYLALAEGYGYARYSSFIPNAKQIVKQHEHEQHPSATCKLKDLLNCKLEDVHLVHSYVDSCPATIVELSKDTLTEEGKQAWSDVLDADVARIFQGIYGTQLELYNINPKRLDQFSTMLAGYCPASDYDLWVNDPDEEVENTMTQIQ